MFKDGFHEDLGITEEDSQERCKHKIPLPKDFREWVHWGPLGSTGGTLPCLASSH